MENSTGFSSTYITRRIDLNANDGLSGYKHHACQQTHNVFEIFYDFLKDVRPVRILEIGTALGGFTMVVKGFIDDLNLRCDILTYDIHEYAWYTEMKDAGVDVRVENIFQNNYQTVDDYVINYIKKDGTTIVLCDGGCKKEEFNILSNFLKPGDYILAHDYATDHNVFEEKINKKIWNWCEITQHDIENACIRNNLRYYKEENFNSVAWTCRVKDL